MKKNVTIIVSLVFLVLGSGLVFASIVDKSRNANQNDIYGVATDQRSAGGGIGCACCGNANPAVAGTKGKAVMKNGYQEAVIEVNGGYKPETLEVKAGVPLKLTFTQGTSSCDSVIILGFAGIQVDVTRGPQTVEIKPLKPGTYEYSCWMNMLRGRIVVTE